MSPRSADGRIVPSRVKEIPPPWECGIGSLFFPPPEAQGRRKEADTVVIAGEALSHCLANTVRDLAAHAGDEAVKRWILLRDTTSAVPGFEREA